MGKGGLPPYQTISIFFLQKVLLVKNDLHALKHDVNTFLEANASLVVGMSVRQSSVFCLLSSSDVTFLRFSVLCSRF